jgi:hypothetical protein
MFKDYWKYDWVLPIYRYEGRDLSFQEGLEKIMCGYAGVSGRRAGL